MRLVLTGGTGFIGSAVLRRLLGADHEVTAVVRSQTSADTVREAGADPVIGDLTDIPWFTGVLSEHDAAIHTASPGDETSPRFEDAVIDAALKAYDGADKPFVHTGGIWTYGDNDDITERSTPAPPALTAWRREREERLLGSGVRASIVEPAVVHGHGQGIPALLAAGPRSDDGALTLVGSGGQHWATVHVDDLAALYLATLGNPDGGRFLGASGHNPTVRELGEAAAGSVQAEDPDATRDRLGAAFADALLLDQQASGEHARITLGWTPSGPTLVSELATGYTR